MTTSSLFLDRSNSTANPALPANTVDASFYQGLPSMRAKFNSRPPIRYSSNNRRNLGTRMTNQTIHPSTSQPRNNLQSLNSPHVTAKSTKSKHRINGLTASNLIESYYSRLGNDLQNLHGKNKKIDSHVNHASELLESMSIIAEPSRPEEQDRGSFGQEHNLGQSSYPTPQHTEYPYDQDVENVVSGPIKRPEVYGVRSPLPRQEREMRDEIYRHHAIQQAHEEWLEKQLYRRTYNLGGFGTPRMSRYTPNLRVSGMVTASPTHTRRLLTRPRPIQTTGTTPPLPAESHNWVGLDGYRELEPFKSLRDGKQEVCLKANVHKHAPKKILGKRGPETRYFGKRHGFGSHDDYKDNTKTDDSDSSTESYAISNPYPTSDSDASTNSDTSIKDKKWPSNVREWLQKWKYNDPEVCCICFMETCNSDNPFVYCDEPDCDVIIHQNCYGIERCPGPEDTWRCDRCESLKINRSKMVICALCPASHGAFRKLEGPFFGMGWVHVACALWIPGVHIADQKRIKGINLRSVEPSCWKGKCTLCTDPVQAEYGGYLSCQETGCKTMFHVSCGQKYGLVRITMSGKRSICCYTHEKRERFKRARPEQRMNLWDRWVETRDDYLENADGETGAKKEFLSAWLKAYKDVSHDSPEACSEAFAEFCDRINVICASRYKNAKAIIAEGTSRLGELYEKMQRNNGSRDQNLLQKELKAVIARVQRASESNRQNKRYYDDILEQATRLSFQLVLKNNEKNKSTFAQPAVQTHVQTPNSMSLSFGNEDFSPDPSANKHAKPGVRSHKKKLPSQLKNALPTTSLPGPESNINWSDSPSTFTTNKKSQTQTKSTKPLGNGSRKSGGKNIMTTGSASHSKSRPRSKKLSKSSKLSNHSISRKKIRSNKKAKTGMKSPKPVEKTNKLPERPVKTAEELSNCICGECNQNELPLEALERLKLPEDYMKRLEDTVHLRLNGYTGKGLNWDPRVFIECSVCKGEFHCGCPNPPIKNYPAPHELFVCVQCDTTAEDLEESEAQKELRDSANRTRVKARINYKE
ncbi:hypothetical protein CLU79DRAFT_728466 [Phycomyces nitens]|nr:hypothetical protein CLU79DRAFT_728466 [Phycomyces nitens]